MMIAPLASSLSQSLITRNNRGVHGGGRLISQTENDDTGRFRARHGQNVSEIQIECEHDPFLLGGFGDDIGIGKPN
jgi:hypothetical protein